MAKKKKKSAAAEKLIDSLMEDLNAPPKESTNAFGKTSTSIAKSSDLIRDLERDISASEQKSQPQPHPETGSPEDFAVGLDEADFAVPIVSSEELNLEPTSLSSYDSGEEVSIMESQIHPFLANNATTYRDPESQVLSVSNIFSSSDESSKDDATRPVIEGLPESEDQTVSLQQEVYSGVSQVTGYTNTDKEKTVAVEGYAQPKKSSQKQPDVDVKVSIGGFRGGRSGNVMTSVDASLAQADNLRLAQQRILSLEKEVESLRAENEELASAADIIRTRSDEMTAQLSKQEHEKADIKESFQSEILMLKGNMQHKDMELAKARQKVDELETRLKSDFKKIRVRERELENRLELLRAEKSALVRSKDEYILDLKRKIDQASGELDNYRKKVAELNRTIDMNQEQVKRTERALRLALNNLEAQEENLVPLKKAE